jgi:hypothetical protein
MAAGTKPLISNKSSPFKDGGAAVVLQPSEHDLEQKTVRIIVKAPRYGNH